MRVTSHSAYMEWVKTQTNVRFNLANSGVKNYPISDLPVEIESLKLSGPGAYGYAPLVSAIAAKCRVSEDCVATAQGTSMANHLAMAAIIEPGDQVLIEHPAYSLLWETAEYLGANVKFFERSASDDFAINIDSLAASLTKQTRLIVITNLHNPSCAVTCTQTIRRIGELAKSVEARVLVDEVYLDLLFDDAPESAFKVGNQFVVTNSLTKVYGLSGLRCGWILAEPEIIRKVYRLNDLFGVNNPYVTDQLSCVALADLKTLAEWSRNLLVRNRDVANEFLASTPAVDCKPLTAGTVIFPRVKCNVDDLCRTLCQRYETIVTPGHFFGAPDRIRIGIGGETAILEGGLARVRDALARIGN